MRRTIRLPARLQAALALSGRGEYVTLEWVDWFNNRHLLEPIGYVLPAGFEHNHYRLNAGQALVA